MFALVDPVDDAISAPAGAMAARERPEQWLSDSLRIDSESGFAELKDRSGHGLRKSLGDGSPGGGLKPDLVWPPGFGRHPPTARRRARSWRTAARSAPGSPRPSAVRLSEIRVTAALSPRISRVISSPSRSSTDSRTASGSPLRVRVMRSCCRRTRLASSDRRALASDRGTGVAATVMVKSIDQVGQLSDQSVTHLSFARPASWRSGRAPGGRRRRSDRPGPARSRPPGERTGCGPARPGRRPFRPRSSR